MHLRVASSGICVAQCRLQSFLSVKGHLGPSPNCHGLVVVVGAGGAVVEQVGARLVDARDEQPRAVGALPGALRVLLRPVRDVLDQPPDLDWLLKDKPAGESALSACQSYIARSAMDRSACVCCCSLGDPSMVWLLKISAAAGVHHQRAIAVMCSKLNLSLSSKYPQERGLLHSQTISTNVKQSMF